ncbi:alpha/beta hydrolase [Isoptericola sp. F-RaC21]|uniref:alpha/beta hydrolase n=1 Tax=Isoptericola sp. F-RaC21 TaxID=3141452 RepID=UPI00315C3B8A
MSESSRHRRSASWLVGLAVASGVLAAARPLARVVRRQRDALAAADRRLLGPLAFVPMILHRAVLPLLRQSPPRAVRPDVRTERRAVPGPVGGPDVEIELYHPLHRSRPSGVLVWVHGGGYVMGSVAIGDTFCSDVAAEGVLVVSVEYRLAPEHPFPAPLDDVMAVLAWVLDHAVDLGVDPERVAVGGDSAGGGLAAGAAQRAHDEGLPVAFQLLVYPMLDDRTVQRAERDGEWALVWTPPANRFGWTAYLGHAPGDRTPAPYAAPARRADLAGLPPAWIGVGDIDLFHAEDVEYARRLRAAGVAVDLDVVPGMFHGGDRSSAVPAAEFRGRAREALRAAIG